MVPVITTFQLEDRFQETPLRRMVESFLNRRQRSARRFPSIETSVVSVNSCSTLELIRGRANINHVKELLGRESLDTLKHYAELNIQDLKETRRKCHPKEREET